jgi:peptidoglycan/xylan/chitin deacetylase (PgdA/CDA1 family)
MAVKGLVVSAATRNVVNLIVHGIGRPDRNLEPGEERTWVTEEQFEKVLDAAVARPDVRITFDDGNTSDVEIALPRLVERGLTAEFFVCAGLFAHRGRIDTDGVRALLAAGMSVGSHGWAHRDWRRLTSTEVDEEITRAPRVIEKLTGEPVCGVAIPFGSYDRHVLRRLRAAQVSRVYTSDGGWARRGAWLQPRNSLRHDLDEEWIAKTMGSAPPFPQRARKAAARTVKRWRGSTM